MAAASSRANDGSSTATRRFPSGQGVCTARRPQSGNVGRTPLVRTAIRSNEMDDKTARAQRLASSAPTLYSHSTSRNGTAVAPSTLCMMQVGTPLLGWGASVMPAMDRSACATIPNTVLPLENTLRVLCVAVGTNGNDYGFEMRMISTSHFSRLTGYPPAFHIEQNSNIVDNG
eukprot:CAMPEP_0119121790 /NCGR_PEP_ID=MMETSP1310-20130426/2256_1 /TAXON_ID=464262 /ORGANISM="Genus nov. species nov., Strain RCC2339" /LENGTH=172 /DNA_ID=CAMNT_0007111369 /DNA_START=209 /DNA_END=726 /DNA_ORIENTATION=+